MNVREFIAWLQEQDQEAEVRVVTTESPPTWESFGRAVMVPLVPGENTEHVDFRENDWVKEGDPRKEKRFLDLGEPR